MLKKRPLDIETTFIPRNIHASHTRIEDVKAKHDIYGKATLAGRKNEPRSEDTDLDETQRALIDETQSFVAIVTRMAGAEIAARCNQIRQWAPQPLDTGLERATIRRQALEAKDTYRDALDTAFAQRQRSLRDLRTFEEDHGLAPLSAIYKDDQAMFVAGLVLLILGESLFNAFTFQELQDQGLLGGLVLAISVGVANVVMGLGAGFLGLRLMTHRTLRLRVLGCVITTILVSAALALHLALGDMREAITHDPKAQIDFLVITKPWRWFTYSTIPPFVLFAVGIAAFVVALLKGRGGSLGIVAPYWQHEVMDRRFRAADQAFEEAKTRFKAAIQQAYASELGALRTRLDTQATRLADIRRLVTEAQGIERTLSDSIDDEIGRQHIWQRMYRDRNSAVRTTPAPAYFAVYPEFKEWRETRLDLSELLALAQSAEAIHGQNRTTLADIQEKILDEQIAGMDALMTTVSGSERRAAQQIQKDDHITDLRIPREAARAE